MLSGLAAFGEVAGGGNRTKSPQPVRWANPALILSVQVLAVGRLGSQKPGFIRIASHRFCLA